MKNRVSKVHKTIIITYRVCSHVAFSVHINHQVNKSCIQFQCKICKTQNHPLSFQLFKFLACVFYFLFSFAYLFKILNVFLCRKAVFLCCSSVILCLELGNYLTEFILGCFVVCLACKGRKSILENAAFFCVCIMQNKENKCTESTGWECIS